MSGRASTYLAAMPWRTGPSRHGETSGSIFPISERDGSAVVSPLGRASPMQAFLVALSTIALAEIGDRTQLLSLALAARYRKTWPIIAGILVATIANHAIAGALGAWFGRLLTPQILDGLVGISMIAMALWVLKADTFTGA